MNPDQDGGFPARDPRFDAAWRRVFNEAPPAALDDAIRAAARRESGAGPRPSDVALREARRPERWWFPLAAAATIGAIALGLLQIVGPDRLPVAGSPAVVSDIPPGTTIPTPAADAPPGSPAGVAIDAPPPAPEAPPAATPEASSGTADAREVHPPESPVARAAPAVPPPAGALPGRGAGRTLDAAAPDALAPAALGAGQPASERASTTKLVPDPQGHRRGDSETRAAAARTALPPAEWIALIRRLRDEGHPEEAARELAAFRAAHPDHETLLPPDLVRWRPDVR